MIKPFLFRQYSQYSSPTNTRASVLYSLMLMRPRTFCSFPCSLALLVLLGAPAFCDSISFTFSGDVDATQCGLSSSTPFSIQYAYDPAQAPVAGSNPADYAIDFTLTVGGYAAQGHGALTLVIQPTFDQFVLGACGCATLGGDPEHLTGAINGIPLDGMTLDILDTISPIDMFSTTHLPGSAQFLSSADFFQLQIEDVSGTREIFKQFGPSELGLSAQAVPEPGTGLLVVGALGILMVCGFAKTCR